MGVLPPPEVTAEVVEERALDLAAQPPDEVYAALGSSPNGLAAAEAQTRLAQYGPNLIEEAKKRPLIYSLLGNLVNIMALLLWAAAALAFALSRNAFVAGRIRRTTSSTPAALG